MWLFFILATPVLVWSAWSWGQRDAKLVSSGWSFQVTGSSMAPTLLGEFGVAECESCELFWYVDAAATQPKPSVAVCSHCGDRLNLDGRKQIAAAQNLGPDVVNIRQVDSLTTEFKRGDLVAIEWDDQLHLKRIAALPGDTIGIDGLRLTINGERLEDLILQNATLASPVRFLVDHDAHRPVSRWSPVDPDSGWTRTRERPWRLDPEDDTSWLLYHHLSVYDHHRPSPVWDDYPFNVGLQRKLHSVDRCSLQGEIRCESTTTLEVAFWSTGGNVLTSLTTSGNQEFIVSFHDAAAAEGLPVSSHSPVAIRVFGGPVELASLSIHRLIEYRIRPHDDRDRYPIRIGAGQCFVLGDNVPVSVDSRDKGLIPTSRIVGLATNVVFRSAK